MTPILTVTLNPALDLAAATRTVRPGIKLRCDAPQVDPGGGGINVSRAIAHLGGSSRALVALGGHTGARLAELLSAEGIDTIPLPAPGETRQSLTVNESESGDQYRFVLPGPPWGATDVETALTVAAEAGRAAGLIVISGSAPPGLPPEFPSLLAARLEGSGARLILDTSGPALAHLAAGTAPRPFILRMDSHEAEGLAGAPLPTRTDTARFAAGLVAGGAADRVIVARGADGSVLAMPEGCWHAMAADVPVVSKVGAGDSFVAGCTLALARGQSAPEALQIGAATASAAVMTPATDLCRREDAEALIPACSLTAL